MAITATWSKYELHFNFEARTSRGAMHAKDTYFLHLHDTDTGAEGVGEVPLFRGLSAEDTPAFETALDRYCRDTSQVPRLSSVLFGVESALGQMRGLAAGTPWHRGEWGIPINGLIWMADKHTMRRRIDAKLDAGFNVLKLKIGGIAFDDEVELLRDIRRRYSPDTLELRLDANGSFAPADALGKLGCLARYGIHSLEQPVKAGQPLAMADICAASSIPIALDEELIGVHTTAEKARLLQTIRPAYIILKPALCGGFAHSDDWIAQASALGIGWWATSALESNVGLEAIASWLACKGRPAMPQGLGTGQLYTNNTPAHTVLRGDRLYWQS